MRHAATTIDAVIINSLSLCGPERSQCLDLGYGDSKSKSVIAGNIAWRSCRLQRYKMRRTTFMLMCMAISGWVSPAYAVPVVPSDPPMSSERIARLPSEIRRIVLAKCGAAAEAGHYFATYDDNSNVVRLDYSLLQCPKVPEHCESSSCVQTFVRHGGKYVPSRSSGNHSPWLYSGRDLTLQ